MGNKNSQNSVSTSIAKQNQQDIQNKKVMYFFIQLRNKQSQSQVSKICQLETDIIINFSPNFLKISDKTLSNIENCNEILGMFRLPSEYAQIFQNCSNNAPLFVKEGALYIGQWNQGFQNGFGQYFYKNGDYYIGSVFLNEPIGYGRMVYVDGSFYEGKWFKGVPYFLGTFYEKNGDIQYVLKLKTREEMKNDNPSLLVNNQSIYYGKLKEGKKQDYGLQEWGDGTYYLGEFQNDQRDGVGIMVYSNGNKYTGHFKNNQFEGVGYFQWRGNQSYYFGRYHKNNKNGFGILQINEIIRQEGWFRDGKLNGFCIQFNEKTNQQERQYWEQGKKLSIEECKSKNILLI